MTRKDYRLIAVALFSTRPEVENNDLKTPHRMGWDETVMALAEALAEDNPQFKRDVFLAACGY